MAKSYMNETKRKQIKQKWINKDERQKKTKKTLNAKKRLIKAYKGPAKGEEKRREEKRREDTYLPGGGRF